MTESAAACRFFAHQSWESQEMPLVQMLDQYTIAKRKR